MQYKCPMTEAWSTQPFRSLKCSNQRIKSNDVGWASQARFPILNIAPSPLFSDLFPPSSNMKLFIVLSLLCVVGISWGKPSSTYTDKWDYINVDEILESQRLLKGYVDCLMDRGRCTADGKSLKETMPDALEHECNKCTDKQKEGADKVISHLVNKRPELWKELASKYDPNNIYQQRYKDKIDAVKETH